MFLAFERYFFKVTMYTAYLNDTSDRSHKYIAPFHFVASMGTLQTT